MIGTVESLYFTDRPKSRRQIIWSSANLAFEFGFHEKADLPKSLFAFLTKCGPSVPSFRSRRPEIAGELAIDICPFQPKIPPSRIDSSDINFWFKELLNYNI